MPTSAVGHAVGMWRAASVSRSRALSASPPRSVGLTRPKDGAHGAGAGAAARWPPPPPSRASEHSQRASRLSVGEAMGAHRRGSELGAGVGACLPPERSYTSPLDDDLPPLPPGAILTRGRSSTLDSSALLAASTRTSSSILSQGDNYDPEGGPPPYVPGAGLATPPPACHAKRRSASSETAPVGAATVGAVRGGAAGRAHQAHATKQQTVSYTHLTLPTILLV